MFTGVMPPASEPGHDDNLNNDDDKDDDCEECCPTEHLTPPFHDKKVTFGCPRKGIKAFRALLSVNHSPPLVCRSSVKLTNRGPLYELFVL